MRIGCLYGNVYIGWSRLSIELLYLNGAICGSFAFVLLCKKCNRNEHGGWRMIMTIGTLSLEMHVLEVGISDYVTKNMMMLFNQM